MFAKSQTQNNGKKGAARAGAGLSMLGDGCSFRGKMLLRGETRIGGHIEGILISEGHLIIEESAQIEADIVGVQIEIAGAIAGNVRASGIVTLTPKARIRGNIVAPRLIVEDGAVINGKVSTEDEGAARAETPETPEIREAASA